MGQALYRKYRSKTFTEIVGQEHITKTLEEALRSGKISHAYLFTGPRGTGKTSVARILAHEVNKLPYNDESIHLDIIEIDAASNRRIDEIRDLRERVHIAPTSAKYKVYIIDEVHMLTREAFNALLKTLEEPPAHCIFILATTEAHKLPETIISRTQRFNFKPIEKDKGTEHLESIARDEKISITPEALELIAQHGEGGLRDSISLLDQLGSSKEKVDAEKVRSLLGIAPDTAIEEIIQAVESGDQAGVLRLLNELKEYGTNPVKIASQLAQHLRANMIKGRAQTYQLSLLKQLIDVPASHNPSEYLEIIILEATGSHTGSQPKPPSDTRGDKDSQKLTPKREQAVEIQAPRKTEPVEAVNGLSLEIWAQVIQRIREQAGTIYTALRLATPTIVEDEVRLVFQFALHQKKINQAKNIDIIGKVIEELTGKRVKISCVVDKTAKREVVPSYEALMPKLTHDEIPLKTISNIFGTAEVLES